MWEISGFNRWSFDIAFAKGGKELVSVTDEYYKFFPVTNTNMTAPTRLIKLPGIRGHNLALSADGSRMAYNTAEGILVGENNGDDPNWKMLTEFPEPLTYDRDLDLTFSADGSLLVSSDPDEKNRVWDLKTFKSIELENTENVPRIFVSEFLFSPNGTLLFGADSQTYEPSTMYLWDARSGKLVRTWTAQFYRFAFHPTQPLFAGADYMGGVVRFFDLRTGDVVREVRVGQYIQDMAFSPDGSLLVLAYEDSGQGEGRVEIRDSTTLDLLKEIPVGSGNLSFSPDGTLLAIGSSDGRIEYWGWR
jgi:DNA-binding beta-propeller fold protein YncE